MKTVTSTQEPPERQSLFAENSTQSGAALLRATCSPRTNVAYSFLLALEWLRSKWRHIVEMRPQQTPVKVQNFTSPTERANTGATGAW